jgi:hypothetical protein
VADDRIVSYPTGGRVEPSAIVTRVVTRPPGSTGVPVPLIGEGTWRIRVAPNLLTRRAARLTIPKARGAEAREIAGAFDFALGPAELASIDAPCK